jgi:hypothetical protein
MPRDANMLATQFVFANTLPFDAHVNNIDYDAYSRLQLCKHCNVNRSALRWEHLRTQILSNNDFTDTCTYDTSVCIAVILYFH